jgi:hypothetical protein
MNVNEDLLLQYNHFLLSHEGNELNIDERRVITKILASKDWKHDKDYCDLGDKTSNMPQHHLQEVINASNCCLTTASGLFYH